jgi:hypothetical protein
MIHEYVHLDVAARNFPEASKRLAAYVSDTATAGRMLGCFGVEIGSLNRIVLMRSFDDDAAFIAERRHLAVSTGPFGLGDHLTGYSAEAYLPFPWFDPVPAGRFGPWYEIRTYDLRLGTLPRLMEAWQNKLPARAALSPVLAAGSALDGVPRFTHLWAYEGLDARFRIRAEAVETGVWPPNAFPGTPPPPMRTMICTPLQCSPLQ